MTISCPICAGPIELTGVALCRLVGHDSGLEESQEDLGREACTALLSAVRALENWISGAKWQLNQPTTELPRLRAEVDQAISDVKLLRDLIEARKASATELPQPRGAEATELHDTQGTAASNSSPEQAARGQLVPGR